MTRADWTLLAVVGALLSLVYLTAWSDRSAGTEITIRSGDQAPRTVTLARDRQLRIDGRLGDSVIEIRDGKAHFLSSPCTSKVCVHTGWLQQSGEFAACLPNGVSLTVAGGKRRYDAINF